MILENKIGYSYNDVTIVPAVVSSVMSRQNVVPFDISDMLPIFTAPMSCVVNEHNYDIFESNRIHAIIPTTIDIEKRHDLFFNERKWVAFSTDEALNLITINNNKYRFKETETYYICIDCANGNMSRLFWLVDRLHEFVDDQNCHIYIMTGNIANPESYLEYCKHRIDFVRVGIGGGSGCITSSNTGVHYPMATLLDDIKTIKQNNENLYPTKIIADGGIRNYSDVIKALALGADYVMIGGLFTECLEAASGEYLLTNNNNYITSQITIDKYDSDETTKREYIKTNNKLFHEVYGMSTKRVQCMRGSANLKTSEGTQHFMPIKYTLSQWSENMESYLRSAMSYTNCFTLDSFRNEVNLIINSNNAVNSVNK